MIRLLKALLAVLFITAGVIVAALNATVVTVDLWLWQIDVPLGLALLTVLLIGALIGGLVVAVGARVSSASLTAVKPADNLPDKTE